MNTEPREEAGVCGVCGSALPHRVPSEVPYCAGRQAVAHTSTAMERRLFRWVCPICGEEDWVA